MYELKEHVNNLSNIGKLQLSTQLCQEVLNDLLGTQMPTWHENTNGARFSTNDAAKLTEIQFELWCMVQRFQIQQESESCA